MHRAAPVLVALSLVLAGCGGVSVRDEVVTDLELIADGEWTADDARARALLDLEAPPHLRGTYPVRLPPVRRKLVTEVRVGDTVLPLPRIGLGWPIPLGLLEALLGLDYERRYQYVAARRTYVLVNRDRKPTIVREDPDAPEPVEPTDPAVFKGLGRALERDVADVHEAAERAREARPTASP